MRALLFALLIVAVPASAHPVLMISIDGLRSKDVTDASRGMNLPNLRGLMKDGAWADNPRINIGCYAVRVEGDAIQVEV